VGYSLRHFHNPNGVAQGFIASSPRWFQETYSVSVSLGHVCFP
jgi:hypothetical protein